MAAQASESLVDERTPWGDFLAGLRWRQGEHVTLIGPTGCGKTTLTNELVELRTYSMFLGSKRIDETQDELKKLGFRTVPDSEQIHPDVARRWYVKPKVNPKHSADSIISHNRDVLRATLMRAYHEGGWAVFIDEGRYVTDILGLKKETVMLIIQGRSQYNSVIMGTQRPRHVPLEAYDQATHIFLWRDPDLQNVARVAEIIGMNRREAQEKVAQLGFHEFLYYNTHTGESTISKVEV